MPDLDILITDDGSPTLIWPAADHKREAMHSRQGAFSETLHVYGRAIEHVQKHSWAPHFLSVGLGLGYIETLIAGHFSPAELSLTSYEISAPLRTWWTAWLADQTTPLNDHYEWILKATAAHCDLPTE